MKTSYEEIFDRFIGKITDHQFLSLPEEDINELCIKYLKSAITKFTKCKKDLTDRNDVVQVFNFELDEIEQEILATLMVVEWLTPQVYNILNTRQFLGDKDYKFYSQANHLKELTNLRDSMIEESERAITSYTWKQDEMEDLK